ncbi:MAG: TadE/TadG family type IV pilus assembly protein [Actinomycetota bacterium]|nr:TadE/TadG family type IV pilus assembly protein [Actinomycetota bacterium]
MRFESGSAVVEFALIMPLVLVLLLGVVEVAVIARTEIQLVHATREGAREAAASPDTSRAAAAVRGALGSNRSDARIAVSRPSTVGHKATVTVSLPYRIATPIFGGFTVTLSSTATMRVER